MIDKLLNYDKISIADRIRYGNQINKQYGEFFKEEPALWRVLSALVGSPFLFRRLGMDRKVCGMCGERKLLTEFWRDTRYKNRYKNWCKVCLTKYNRKYFKKFFKDKPWLEHYRNAKKRCNYNYSMFHHYWTKGIKFHLTHQEIKMLWFRDKAYLLKRPSIHRIDNDDDYVFENCKFIELSENSRLGGLC